MAKTWWSITVGLAGGTRRPVLATAGTRSRSRAEPRLRRSAKRPSTRCSLCRVEPASTRQPSTSTKAPSGYPAMDTVTCRSTGALAGGRDALLSVVGRRRRSVPRLTHPLTYVSARVSYSGLQVPERFGDDGRSYTFLGDPGTGSPHAGSGCPQVVAEPSSRGCGPGDLADCRAR
jgi:hypothetical protein